VALVASTIRTASAGCLFIMKEKEPGGGVLFPFGLCLVTLKQENLPAKTSKQL
jgi:hypothetical protein